MLRIWCAISLVSIWFVSKGSAFLKFRDVLLCTVKNVYIQLFCCVPLRRVRWELECNQGINWGRKCWLRSFIMFGWTFEYELRAWGSGPSTVFRTQGINSEFRALAPRFMWRWSSTTWEGRERSFGWFWFDGGVHFTLQRRGRGSWDCFWCSALCTTMYRKRRMWNIQNGGGDGRSKVVVMSAVLYVIFCFSFKNSWNFRTLKFKVYSCAQFFELFTYEFK